MKIKFSYLLLLAIPVLSASCTKEEGEGGTSTIRGKVKVMHLTGSLQFDTTYYGADEDVYILYGTDDATYDDDFKTSYDGTYEFKYLQEGTYRVFAYTTDTTHFHEGYIDEDLPELPVFQTVEITGKNQTVEVPEIVIIKYN